MVKSNGVRLFLLILSRLVLNKLSSLKQLANGVASSDEELCKGLAYPTRYDSSCGILSPVVFSGNHAQRVEK